MSRMVETVAYSGWEPVVRRAVVEARTVVSKWWRRGRARESVRKVWIECTRRERDDGYSGRVRVSPGFHIYVRLLNL